MLNKLALFFAVAVALTACSPTTLVTTFNPLEAAYIHNTGKATISGQAFLRRNDGIVVYGAGSEVDLIPVTTYSRERIQAIYKGTNYSVWTPGFKNSDPAYENYIRKTTADGEGRFKFEGVADGSYYVVTAVVWMVQYAQQGGALKADVTIKDGKPVELIMTGQ